MWERTARENRSSTQSREAGLPYPRHLKGMNHEALQRLRTQVRLRTMSAATLARLILSLEIFGTGSMSPPPTISPEQTQTMSEQLQDDWHSILEGTSMSVRVELGGRR